MSTPFVRPLQVALRDLGYAIPNGITDYFGQETRTALWKFQTDNGIQDDGSHFGPKTRHAMNTKINPEMAFGGSLATFVHSLFSGV